MGLELIFATLLLWKINTFLNATRNVWLYLFCYSLAYKTGSDFLKIFSKFNKYKMAICYCTINAPAHWKSFANDFIT